MSDEPLIRDDGSKMHVGRHIHKATPADPEAHSTSCLVCKEAVHRVPGGHGTTYVHTATGAVSASGGAP